MMPQGVYEHLGASDLQPIMAMLHRNVAQLQSVTQQLQQGQQQLQQGQQQLQQGMVQMQRMLATLMPAGGAVGSSHMC